MTRDYTSQLTNYYNQGNYTRLLNKAKWYYVNAGKSGDSNLDFYKKLGILPANITKEAAPSQSSLSSKMQTAAGWKQYVLESDVNLQKKALSALGINSAADIANFGQAMNKWKAGLPDDFGHAGEGRTFDPLTQKSVPITSSQGKSPLELTQTIQNQGGYTGPSIVDYLSSVGQANDFASRTKLAQQYGITNYTGTAAQNTQLLNTLRTKGSAGSTGGAGGTTGTTQDTGAIGMGVSPATSSISGPVGTSGPARTEIKLADIQKAVANSSPKALDLFTSADEKALKIARNDKVAIEDELSEIQNAQLALDDEFRKYKVQSGKEISQVGYEGGLSEKSRELQFQADTLNRRTLLLETKLQSRNNVISELMQNQKLDYSSAVDQYNTQFSQALQLYGVMKSEENELVTNARASVDMIVNSLKTNPGAFTNPSASSLRKWSELEVQAGLPEGYIQSLAQVAGQMGGYDYKGTIGGAETGYSALFVSPDGDVKVTKLTGGVGGGGSQFSSAQINSTINQIAGAFDNEQIVKDYNQISQSLQAVKSAGTSPTDDIQRVYAFAKIMDPNSVVREGEYNTVEKYAQAVIQHAGLKAVRVFSNTGFLTKEARNLMLSTLQNRFAATESAYKNLYSQYQQRIEQAKAGQGNTLTDYSASNNQTSGLPTNIQQTVKSNLTFSPDNKTAYLPRAIWSTLGQYMDSILEEAQKDGITLLIN